MTAQDYFLVLPPGAPPAYPGLAHNPGSNHPPAYSPSLNHPPAYSQTFYNKAFGSTFGKAGLSKNTYIVNNYFGGPRASRGSPFLANALFHQVRMSHGGGSSSRNWNNDEDRRWRATTKAPYFENKVPGSRAFLPAAAVIGNKMKILQKLFGY